MIRPPINKNTAINTSTSHSKTIIKIHPQLNFLPASLIYVENMYIIKNTFLYTLFQVICLIILATTIE